MKPVKGQKVGEYPGRRTWGAGRAILHVDLDCFFAAVEILHDPRLRGLAVIVGGTGPRGVVAAASYEARVWGVHSAMPMVTAKRLCPDGVFIDGTYSRYSEVSQRFHEILHRFTDEIESIGLDEAFMDISSCLSLFGPPESIAAEIRRLVGAELGLSACVGVGTTKQVAKLASKRAKPQIKGRLVSAPRGVVVIGPGQEREFLGPISVRELWGVGPKTYERLHAAGVEKISDLWSLSESALSSVFAKAGPHIRQLASGTDSDPVVSGSKRKSIGHEQTYPADLTSPVQVDRELVKLADALAARMGRSKVAGRTVTLKIRYGDFRTITRSFSFASPTDSRARIVAKLRELLPEDACSEGIRLLGVSASNLAEKGGVQMTFDDASQSQREEALSQTVAKIRERFGADAVAPASLVEGGGVAVHEENRLRWGNISKT